MKTFMVSIAIFFLSMSFLIYQGDLNRYIALQTFLKAVAEEAACTGALFYDEEAYSQGFMVINKEEGERYLDELIRQATEGLNLQGEFSLTGEMEVEDKCVIVHLELNCKDIFRLPYLKKEKVLRSAKYELAHY